MPLSDPMVTVLMSVYNDRGYLAQAVESILGQTFADFEFLIIDDGSVVPLEGLLESYKDDRIVCVRQYNMGLTRSLNRGLSLARGEYVARMDADDVSLPGRLAAQVAAVSADPHLDMVGTFFDVVDDCGDLIEHKELIMDPVYRLWRLQFHNNYGHGTMMLRRAAVMAEGMYDESLSFAQDYDLWCRLSTGANTLIIPEALYHYRMAKNSSQASVRNYDEQLATAVSVSNRNLRACNPALGDSDLIDLRALYWKFQRAGISKEGFQALPGTLEGFCRRFGIGGSRETQLRCHVLQDAVCELSESAVISDGDKSALRLFLDEQIPYAGNRNSLVGACRVTQKGYKIVLR